MHKSIVLAAALLLTLTGCIGELSTEASPGDQVRYEMRFFLPDGSPLGPAVEGEPVRVPAPEDNATGVPGQLRGLTAGQPERIDGTLVARERVFGPFSALGEISMQQFTGLFGQPEPGMTFSPQQGFYDFRVEAVEDGTVIYRAMPEPGQEDPVPVLGSNLRTDVQGDDLVQTLVPENGTRIMIQPPNPMQGTPLNLPPGEYVVAGNNATHVFFWTFEQDVEGDQALDAAMTLTVRRIDRTTLLGPLDDNLGVRDSPQLRDVPGAPAVDDHDHGAHNHGEPADDHGHEDDGHGGHQH